MAAKKDFEDFKKVVDLALELKTKNKFFLRIHPKNASIRFSENENTLLAHTKLDKPRFKQAMDKLIEIMRFIVLEKELKLVTDDKAKKELSDKIEYFKSKFEHQELNAYKIPYVSNAYSFDELGWGIVDHNIMNPEIGMLKYISLNFNLIDNIKSEEKTITIDCSLTELDRIISSLKKTRKECEEKWNQKQK